MGLVFAELPNPPFKVDVVVWMIFVPHIQPGESDVVCRIASSRIETASMISVVVPRVNMREFEFAFSSFDVILLSSSVCSGMGSGLMVDG